MAVKRCEICGAEFEGGGNERYCEGCKTRPCAVCGRPVEMTDYARAKLKRDGFVCCCGAHTRAMRPKAERDASKPYRSVRKTCALCGREFEGGANSRYCDDCKVQPCAVCGRPVRLDAQKMSRFVENGYVTCGSAGCAAEMRRRTSMRAYGVDNPSKTEAAKEKIRAVRASESEETKRLRSESLKRSCGSEEVKRKRRETSLERYGVESVLSLPEVHGKAVEAARSEESVAKREKTNLERYGVPNPFMTDSAKSNAAKALASEETRAKIRATMMERHGVPHPWANDTERRIVEYVEAHPDAGISEVADSIGVGYWAVEIQNRLKGLGVKTRVSRLESEMEAFLESLGVTFVRRDRKTIGPKELDFLLPDFDIAIEVNDVWSHNSTVNVFNPSLPPKGRSYHFGKYSSASSAGIQLISVWEWQISDPVKFDIVRSMIASRLHLIGEKVYARKCVVVDLDEQEARRFFDENHLQGRDGAKECKGLMFGGEVVAAMSFRGDELTRFCSKTWTVVVGGFSKLLASFGKSRVVTFSFNDYSDGGLYARNGFRRVSDVPPRYWWVKRRGYGDIDVLPRRSCQKRNISKMFGKEYYDYLDPNDARTESDLMEGAGYVRVFDSGKVKWELDV